MSLTSVPYEWSPIPVEDTDCAVVRFPRIQLLQRSPIQASSTAPIRLPWLTATSV